MIIKTVDSNQAFAHLSKILGTPLTSDTDIVITHSNQPIVVVVPYQDYLAMQEDLKKLRLARQKTNTLMNEAVATMLASQDVLSREWNLLEEDEAWADL